MAWFLIPGLLTRSFHIGTVTGIGIALILIVYGIWGKWINKLFRMIWQKTAGKLLLCFIGAVAAAVLGLAVACMICMGNGRQSPPEEGSTVVVLGCRVYNYGPSLMLVARLEEAYDYLQRNPDSACIVCGGKGDNEPREESAVMKDYLVAMGIDPVRIYTDSTSMDTMENLTNAAEIIRENSLNERCAIVTSDYHVYRALKYAGKLGYKDAGGVPSYTLWWLFPSSYIREMYGIMELWFINR
mgnify:CR=1 FL=1